MRNPVVTITRNPRTWNHLDNACVAASVTATLAVFAFSYGPRAWQNWDRPAGVAAGIVTVLLWVAAATRHRWNGRGLRRVRRELDREIRTPLPGREVYR